MKKSSKTPPRWPDHLSPPSPAPPDPFRSTSASPNSNSNTREINAVGLPYNSPLRPQVALQQPSNKKSSPSKSTKILRRFRSVFRSLPILTPAACRFPGNLRPQDGHIHGGTRLTGTLYGHKKSRINLALQEKPRCLPLLVLELSTTTSKLLQDVGLGLVRIALECEKNPSPSEKKRLVDEPLWTMYCNGRKTGYGVRREPTEHDISVMQMLHAVSMGAGVLPIDDDDDCTPEAGELTYTRAYFERVVGSRDSETYYMINPDGNTGPELTIFFVRI